MGNPTTPRRRFNGDAAKSVVDAAALAGLVLLNLAVWGSAIFNGFVFDDLTNVVANNWITGWRQLSNAFTHHVVGFDPAYNTSFYRPLMHVFYAAAYAAAGREPWVFHLLNVTLHVAAVLCAYVFTRAVLVRWSDPARYRFLPLIAGLVFSLHPAHSEAVAWIAGITDISYTVFGLAALLLYMRAFTHSAISWASALFLVAAMLSKETGAVVVLLIAVLEVLEARTCDTWSVPAALRRLIPPFLAMGAYAFMRFAALRSFAPSAHQHPHRAIELFATAAALFARYVQVLVAPVNLNAMRSIPVEAGFGGAAVVAGFIIAAALLVIFVRVRRFPLLVLAIALITLPIVPTLYIPALESAGSLFGERYLYLPVLGIAWCLGFALEEVRHRLQRGALVSVAVIVILVVSSAASVVARNRVWTNSLSLFSDAALKSPEMPAAHEGLCYALYGANRFEEALHECDTAIALDPTRVDARVNRAASLLALGLADQALRELDVALAMRPNSPEALVNRGLACMILGRTDQALTSYTRALQLAPEYAEAHNDLGVALVRLGRPREALSHFQQAVRSTPDNAEYRANLDACPR